MLRPGRISNFPGTRAAKLRNRYGFFVTATSRGGSVTLGTQLKGLVDMTPPWCSEGLALRLISADPNSCW